MSDYLPSARTRRSPQQARDLPSATFGPLSDTPSRAGAVYALVVVITRPSVHIQFAPSRLSCDYMDSILFTSIWQLFISVSVVPSPMSNGRLMAVSSALFPYVGIAPVTGFRPPIHVHKHSVCLTCPAHIVAVVLRHCRCSFQRPRAFGLFLSPPGYAPRRPYLSPSTTVGLQP